jgi:hypothetical protein
MNRTVRELIATGHYKFVLDGEELITQLDLDEVKDTTYVSLVLHDTVILGRRATGGNRLSFDIPYELMLGGTVYCKSAIPGDWEFRWRKTFATYEEWSCFTSEWREVQVLSLPLGAACVWSVERIPLVGK